ncbi:MAG: choice-of-anchor J domain-containing protein [Bacteroidales bacterium]|nr:choice-of-anchor J domain-containing protein [Bacteroidales bacterium]
MKKLIFTLFAMLTVFATFAQNKNNHFICEQQSIELKGTRALWAEVGDFTATDIDGSTHTLSTYLNAGKTVIIDFSCAWCSPCWSLHSSGVLDDLHNTYGPAGTDEIVVLWIEIESTNTLAQISGTSSGTSSNHDTYSQGDWTVGGTWPVPIIDNAAPLNQFTELYEGYVPTVFMVCPSGFYKDVTDQCWTSAAAVYAEVGSCPASGQVPVAEISGPSSGYIGNNLSFSNEGVSVDPITSYAWTFENGTPATSDVANPSVSWATAGEYDVTLVVTNANGSSPVATHTVNIIDPGNVDDLFVTFEEIIVSTTFPTVFAPYNWTTVDVDGGTVWSDFSEFGVTGTTNAFSCYSHTLADSDYAPYAGDKCGFAMTNNPGAGNGSYNNDWFISPQITLGTGSSFSLYVRSTNASWGNEEYKIAVSTTDNVPASFIVLGTVAEAPATWTQVTKDLSEYDGLDIYIAVNYVGEDHFAFMIDNLQITTTPTDVEGVLNLKTQVFPNPANDQLNINFVTGANIRILNNLGQVVMSLDNAQEYNKIDISQFNAGTYFVSINKDNTIENHKLVIIK